MIDGECYFAFGVKQSGEGWAKCPFSGSKAHYFDRAPIPASFSIARPDLTGIFDSLCGFTFFATDRVPLLNPGNWPHCKLCERALAKRSP